MANITAAMVKDLREKTGAGMMDCKTALNENNGDMEAAVDWLRTKGLAKAAKKAGRVAAEGLVSAMTTDGRGALVEVNSETDFVARNEIFQEMVRTISSLAVGLDGDEAAVRSAEYPGSNKSVEEHVTQMVGHIGENMSFRRSAGLAVSPGVVASYVHNATSDGLGKIGVLVALQSEGDKHKLEALGKQIAMHIAATAPLALSEKDIDPDVVAKEREMLIAEAKESGKPDNIIEKMVDGRIRKFLEEVVLLKQAFVINPDLTVEKAVKDAEADVGAPIDVVGFERFALGEGIEKEASDFAAEVAAAAAS